MNRELNFALLCSIWSGVCAVTIAILLAVNVSAFDQLIDRSEWPTHLLILRLLGTAGYLFALGAIAGWLVGKLIAKRSWGLVALACLPQFPLIVATIYRGSAGEGANIATIILVSVTAAALPFVLRHRGIL